jgi:hypothetical protein
MREETENKTASLMGSLLYMAAPNHLAQNFYYVMLLSSTWSYAWLPLLFLYAEKVALRCPYAIAGFAISLFLLVMTSLPMTLIFGPLAVAYGVLHFRKPHLPADAARLSAAVLLGFGLTAIYLLPALLYRGFANTDIMWWHEGNRSLYVPYSKQFLIFSFNSFNQTLYTIFWMATAAVTLAYCKTVTRQPQRFFFTITTLAALLMILPLSQPLWEIIPIFQILQQPARFFSVPALGIALLAACAWPRLKILSCALLVVYAAATVITAFPTRTTMESFHKEEPQRFEQFMLNIDQYANYLTTPDLIHRYFTPVGVADVKRHLAQVEVLTGDAQVEIKEWKPRHILLRYHARVPSTLRVRQFDFPGFAASLGGSNLDIRRDEKTGQVVFDVPEGEGDIQLELAPLIYETAGKIISMLCAIMMLILLFVEVRRYGHDKRA